MSTSAIERVIPGIAMLRSYRPRWLGKDLTAGLVLSALLVPQGMAYAELAGLPAITGLYTTILCLLGYAVFGPSKVLVLGPDSSLGPMIAATIIPLVAAHGDPARAVAYASMLALLVGLITVLAGAFHLGFVADLLSRPTQIGYINGLALTIVIGQLPKLFGFSVDGDGLIAEAKGFVRGVADGLTIPAALLVGIGSLLVILLLGRFLPRIPGVLVAVVAAIAAAAAFHLGDRGVDLVGALPQGFPPFTIPTVPLERPCPAGRRCARHRAGLAHRHHLTASAFAARRGDDVDGDREMIGIGAANIAAGLFQGFPVSTSGSRTAVAEQNGAKSQVTGLVGALAVTLMLVFVPGLLKNLPQPTLAAIVIAASMSLADMSGHASAVATTPVRLRARHDRVPGCRAPRRAARHRHRGRTLRARRVPTGLASAPRGPRPGTGLAGYHDTLDYPDAEQLPGLVMYRFDAPLIFANARTFRDDIRRLADRQPAPPGSSSPPNRSPTSTPRRRTCSPTSTSGSTNAASASCSPKSSRPSGARSNATN